MPMTPSELADLIEKQTYGLTPLHECRIRLMAPDWRTIIAALRSPPTGFKVVPVEPTEAMYAAAEREWDGRMSARIAGVWQAMLEAAP